MSNHSHEMEAPRGQFLVYQAEDGKLKLDVRFEDESVWLTQQLMAELFQSSKQNVSHHINAIYEERELTPEATVKKYLTVRIEKTATVHGCWSRQYASAPPVLSRRTRRLAAGYRQIPLGARVEQ